MSEHELYVWADWEHWDIRCRGCDVELDAEEILELIESLRAVVRAAGATSRGWIGQNLTVMRQLRHTLDALPRRMLRCKAKDPGYFFSGLARLDGTPLDTESELD